MTTEPADFKPDVEAIIARIRQDAQRAEASVPAAQREGERLEEDLRGNLAAANRACAVGKVPSGPSGLLARLAYRIIRPLIGEINGFNGHAVRVLNRIVRVLEGDDATLSGDLIDLQRRRVTLMERMSGRLATFDAMRIEERLAALEERLGKSGGKETR
jgi:hypothetical protein